MNNINTAIKFFNQNPNLKKMVPVQDLKTAVVKYVKDGDLIQKVVTRKDGTEAIGMFRNGKLVQADVDNVKGRITVNFDPNNEGRPEMFQFAKTTTITNANGDSFTRCTRSNGQNYDIWCPQKGVVKTGKMDALFNEFKNNILK